MKQIEITGRQVWVHQTAERPEWVIIQPVDDHDIQGLDEEVAWLSNAIRRQNELLTGQIENSILEWNPGNHFVDSEKRMDKGFAWVFNVCLG